MPRLVATLLLSALVPAGGAVVYFVAFLYGQELLGRSYSGFRNVYVVAGLVTWAAVAAAWVVLWRSHVDWTPGRVRGTWLAALVALIAGVSLGILTAPIEPGIGWFFATATPPLMWMGATVIAWQDSDAERVRRTGHAGHGPVMCPTCRYDLTGLTDTRCPECGGRLTLDELFARQPGRGETLPA